TAIHESGCAIEFRDTSRHRAGQLCADVARDKLEDAQHDRNNKEEHLHGGAHLAERREEMVVKLGYPGTPTSSFHAKVIGFFPAEPINRLKMSSKRNTDVPETSTCIFRACTVERINQSPGLI